jgi:phosphoserine phosphatase
VSTPFLPAGNWAPENHARLDAWLASLAQRTARGEKLTAAFDWDNTCVFRDIGDATLRWQADHLELRLTPDELAQVLPERIGEVDTIAGVRLADVRADLLDAYKTLWPAIGRGEADKVRGTPAHQDFRAKLAWLYDAVGSDSRVGHAYGYQWVTRFLAGMSEREVHKLSDTIVRTAAKEPLGKELWTAASEGKSGKLSFAVDTGMRAQDEVKELMRGLKRAGVEVYVVSASLQALVQGAATALGYEVLRKNIFGMRLSENAEGKYTTSAPADYFTPYREGKTALIRALLPFVPVLVAGDANTDYEMLTDFGAQTEIRLVFNRNSSGDIRRLYDEAVSDTERTPGPGHSVTLLQGRDENTGLCQADRRTTPSGEGAPRPL